MACQRANAAVAMILPFMVSHAALAAPGADEGGPILGVSSFDPGPQTSQRQRAKPTEDARANFPGRIFLVTRKQDDPMSGVVAIDPNSVVVRKIIEDNFQGTRISPDGRFVASTGITACGRDSKERGIWIYDTLSEKKPLKIFDGASVPCGWSRDGTEILVSSSTPPRREFVTWRVKVDGTGKRRLPVSTTEMVSDWSPDGRWLLSWSTRKTPEMPYYLVSPEGGEERLLLASFKGTLEHGGRIGPWPWFSPDGRQILANHFIDDDSSPPKLKSTELLVMDVDSGKVRKFFRRDAGNHTYTACWSPDGKAIAVTVLEGSEAVHHPQIELVDLEGRSLRTIPLPLDLTGPWLVGWK
jgi:Tol biopolymer transport system component